MSQCGGIGLWGWFVQERFEALDLGDGGGVEQIEDDLARTFGEERCGDDVAHDGLHLCEAGLPAALADVAEKEGVGLQPSRDEHGAGGAKKSWPAGRDSNEDVGARREPVRERGGNGADLKCDEIGSGGESFANEFSLTWQCERDGTEELFGLARFGEIGAFDAERDGMAKLLHHNAPEFFVGLDYEEVIGRLECEEATEPRADGCERNSESPRRTEEICDEFVEGKFGGTGGFGFGCANENTTTVPELHPVLLFKLAIARTDGVGVDFETSRELTCAGKPFAGREIVTKDSQNNLGNQLFADGDVAVACKPEAHHVKDKRELGNDEELTEMPASASGKQVSLC